MTAMLQVTEYLSTLAEQQSFRRETTNKLGPLPWFAANFQAGFVLTQRVFDNGESESRTAI